MGLCLMELQALTAAVEKLGVTLAPVELSAEISGEPVVVDLPETVELVEADQVAQVEEAPKKSRKKVAE